MGWRSGNHAPGCRCCRTNWRWQPMRLSPTPMYLLHAILTTASGSGLMASATTLVSRTIIQSNLKGCAGVLSRTLSKTARSSLVRPILRPISDRASPTRIRFSGFTTAARISRTSASVLRPCRAARLRKARCTSSGTFRTVKMATIQNPSSAFDDCNHGGVLSFRQASSAMRTMRSSSQKPPSANHSPTLVRS